MASKYTAQQLREHAEWQEKLNGPNYIVADMLRQAADEMEREKDFEYTVIAKKHDGEVFIDTEHFGTLESAKKNAEEGFYDVIRYVRREVGKWEEVPNDNN